MQLDERRELAPRDIVARAIDHEMKRIGADCVYLDVSHLSSDFIQGHFPNIAQKAPSWASISPRTDSCGTCRPLHLRWRGGGRSRAYGSAQPLCHWRGQLHRSAWGQSLGHPLLECLVCGHRAAEKIISTLDRPQSFPYIPKWDESKVTDSDESVNTYNWDELRRFMWDYVGIVRTDKRLMRAH